MRRRLGADASFVSLIVGLLLHGLPATTTATTYIIFKFTTLRLSVFVDKQSLPREEVNSSRLQVFLPLPLLRLPPRPPPVSNTRVFICQIVRVDRGRLAVASPLIVILTRVRTIRSCTASRSSKPHLRPQSVLRVDAPRPGAVEVRKLFVFVVDAVYERRIRRTCSSRYLRRIHAISKISDCSA